MDVPRRPALLTALASIVLAAATVTRLQPVLAQAPQPKEMFEGTLEVLYEDDDYRGRLLHFLNTGTARLPLRFRGEPPDLMTGARVRVSGNTANGALELTRGDVAQDSGSMTQAVAPGVSTARTFGEQTVLVILFNFSNNTSQPYTPASTATVNDQVRTFYLENSYGQTSMTFTVTGWHTIAAANTTCDYSTWATRRGGGKRRRLQCGVV